MDFLSTEDQKAIYIQNCIHILSATILYYDHAMTLPAEISHVWSRHRIGTQFLFLLNRYFTFFVNIVVTVFSFHDFPPARCRIFVIFRELSLIASTGIVSFLLMLRIYAICGCNPKVLFSLIATGIGLSGIICWALVTSKSNITQIAPGCHIADSAFTGISKSLSNANSGSMTIDIQEPQALGKSCLAWISWFSSSPCTSRTRLGTCSRDGGAFRMRWRFSSYATFAAAEAFSSSVMALANLGNILTFYFARASLHVSEAILRAYSSKWQPLLKGTLSTFASNISVTLMSRLMLNLYENNDRSAAEESLELSAVALSGVSGHLA
ncbi:hypothetical protein OE88DRAFT_1810978 [Heliocybe sulcata]|uniref:DUF6533 domain-containing protein n=1 Tax=Heliocybe sulcata TaxID=5364 RepID=A0A5C3MQ29_9AGAM|nr:hypothetical protein OE88DRAFT_1810978 [Heliocybe sulcata]